MNKNTEKLLVNTKELQEMLSCGRHTAEWIGNDADAKVQIGRAVRWKVKKIEKYLEDKKEVIR